MCVCGSHVSRLRASPRSVCERARGERRGGDAVRARHAGIVSVRVREAGRGRRGRRHAGRGRRGARRLLRSGRRVCLERDRLNKLAASAPSAPMAPLDVREPALVGVQNDSVPSRPRFLERAFAARVEWTEWTEWARNKSRRRFVEFKASIEAYVAVHKSSAVAVAFRAGWCCGSVVSG